MPPSERFYRNLDALTAALQEQTRREKAFAMHYKNGREANVGDLVIGKGYNIPGVIVGRMLSINPATSTCNCTVAVVGDAAQPVKTEYSQCDNFVHADDAFNALNQLAGVPTASA